MFQTGSQINPSLGRTDYSAYAQGAVAGGQAIGQGIANLAQGFANGIEKYQKNKEENQKLDDATTFIGNLLKKNPQLAENFNLTPDENGEFDKKAIRSAAKIVGPAPFLQLAQSLSTQADTTASQNRVSRFILEQNKQEQANRGLGEATPEGVLSGPAYQAAPIPKLTAVEEVTGMKTLSALRQDEANLAETRAKTLAAGVPKAPNLSFQEQEMNAEKNAFINKNGREPNAEETAQLFATVGKRRVPQEKNPYQAKVVDQLFTLDNAARAAPQALENIDAEINLIDSGEVSTGFLGNVNQGINQVRALLGDKKAAKSVTDTQVLESLLGADLLSQIKASGLTTRSFDTPAELENLRKALVGSTQLEPATIKKIALLRKKNIELLLETHGKRIDSGAYDDLYSAYGEKPQKIVYNKQVIVNY
jgi:hypothetical protein